MDKLEYKINEVAFNIAQILDKNEINKLLGVLANDGVYAMWVYALDKLDWEFKDDAQKMKEQELFKFLGEISKLTEYLGNDNLKLDLELLLNELAEYTENIENIKNEIKKSKNKEKENRLKEKIKERNEKLNKFFIDLSNDIDNLLFFKEILERVLILARYHAKALGDD